MSGGVGGIGGGDSVPPFVPFQTSNAPGTEPEEVQVTIDPDPEFLQLTGSAAGIELPEGQVSLVEWARIISEAIQELRASLNESEFQNAELNQKYYASAISDVNDLITEYVEVQSLVADWESRVKPLKESSIEGLENLRNATVQFNNELNDIASNDEGELVSIQYVINTVNSPSALQNYINNFFGGNQSSARNFLNGQIGTWNNYLNSRLGDIDSTLDDLVSASGTYNSSASQLNSQLSQVNQEREEYEFTELEGFPTVNNSQDIEDYLPYNGNMTTVAPLSNPLFFTQTNQDGSVTYTYNSANQRPGISVSNPTQQVEPADAPPVFTEEELEDIARPPYTEAFSALWVPGALSTNIFLSFFTSILRIAEAFRDDVNAFEQGFSIVLPSAFVEPSNATFIENISGIGSGAGLAGFAIGLYSKNLEIALSSGTFRAIAADLSTPASAREFGRLQLTAMELLFRSSLLSPLPAARFLASRLGTLSASSPAIAVAISEAQLEQVGELIGSGTLRNQVNTIFNRQFRTLGFQSIGGLAQFTRAVSSTLSLSILSVALAQLGRRIGLPGLVAQVFAQGSGVPTSELLVALTAGSRIRDVLDNPISVLFVKQTLTDLLAYRRGFSSTSVALQINSAINSILLRGGINSFSHLRSELATEFQKSGFSRFEANLLANETSALIRGDLGVRTLDAAFGLNFDPATVAASIVDNLQGLDVGLAAAMLSNTVTRSLLFGGFGSRVRLKSELSELFMDQGLSRNDAAAIADQTADLIESIGVLVPLGQYPGVASLLLSDPVVRGIALGEGINREELLEDLEDRGLTNTQAERVADAVKSLEAREFARSENLLKEAVEEAILRSIVNQELRSQRELRDRIQEELRAVGFDRNAAGFLANSAAVFGLNGSLSSPLGISASALDALNQSAVNRLISDLGISRSQAEEAVASARNRAILSGPFSSEDQFKAILREAIHREVAVRFGSFDGFVSFDRAVADLAPSGTLLNVGALAEQLSAHIVGVLRPDLGTRLAEEIKDRILTSVLGAATVDEIQDEEQRNPLSALNQVNSHIEKVLDIEEEAEQRRLLRKLIQLLESLMRPNAEIGYLLQSLMDNPSTFIGSLLVDKPKGEFLDIPV